MVSRVARAPAALACHAVRRASITLFWLALLALLVLAPPAAAHGLRVRVAPGANGLTVAASAVQQGPSGAYVYVIDPNNTVASRPVKVAQISEGQALIDSGLKADEQVVVDGQYKLQPGTHVTILHGRAAEEAAAQDALQAPIP